MFSPFREDYVIFCKSWHGKYISIPRKTQLNVSARGKYVNKARSGLNPRTDLPRKKPMVQAFIAEIAAGYSAPETLCVL
jgi:hypothetical protein